MAVITTGLLAGAAMSGGAFLVDRMAVATIRPRQRAVYDTEPEAVPYRRRRVTFDSDGHTLRGWVFDPEESASGPLAILVHGWSANAGTVLRLAGPLLSAGFPVMAFDIRGHGSSDAAPFVTIRHFRDDVLAAVRFAETGLPYRRRVAIGHSMGAAASALAADRGAAVHGLGLVAGPSDIMKVTRSYLSERGLPGGFIVRLCRPSWRLRAGEPFVQLRPDASLSRVTVPVRIVQGSEDTRVTRDHAESLSRAAGQAVTEVAGHGHTDVLESDETHTAIRELMTAVST